MPNVVLVGAQWGDEGKGKVTDLIARDFDYVVRYQAATMPAILLSTATKSSLCTSFHLALCMKRPCRSSVTALW